MPTVQTLLLAAGVLAVQGASAHPAPAGAQLVTQSPADTVFEAGRMNGLAEADDASVGRHYLGGFGWSVVLGPLGGVIAVRRAGGSPLPIPEEARERFEARGDVYRLGYEEGFDDRFSPRRREATIVGSLVGSLAWTAVLLAVVDVRSLVRGDRTAPGNDEPVFIRFSVPVP